MSNRNLQCYLNRQLEKRIAMWSSAILNLCLLTKCVFSFTVSGNYKVFPEENAVHLGEGFIIRLFRLDSDEPPFKCQLEADKNKNYIWKSGDIKPFTLPNGEQVHPVHFYRACGFRVFNVVKKSEGTWNLGWHNETTLLTSKPAYIRILKPTNCPNESWNDCRLLSLDNYYLGSCNETFRDHFSYKCDFIGAGKMSRQSINLTANDTWMETPLKSTHDGNLLLVVLLVKKNRPCLPDDLIIQTLFSIIIFRMDFRTHDIPLTRHASMNTRVNLNLAVRSLRMRLEYGSWLWK